MTNRTPIHLRRADSGDIVEGELIETITSAEILSAQRQWTEFVSDTLLYSGKPPDHKHWDWVRKARYAKSRRQYRFLGVAADGQIQGLMLLSDNHLCRLDGQTGDPMLYIDYVSTAPWNLRGITPNPRFTGVGLLLVATAIRLSLRNGFDGRIGLHSLAQAASFYAQTCGMTDLGIDAAEANLRYFEATPEQAQRFLERKTR